MKYLLMSLVPFFLGCSTSAYWVQQNYEPRGGIVAYNNNWILGSSRAKDAQQKMEDYCAQERVRIISSDFGVATAAYNAYHTPYQSTVIPVNVRFTRIIFQCDSQTVQND